ncbi:MAG: carbamoyl phosphate synthase small subunit [Eubacteriales bacterium]|nr:carbamoyl phosphate synthase small subunit [Eubacteriales bacterium]MDD4630249.1 carbamoyl phosphate synthase small subunit [Eubacteriales bacterium]
MEKNNATIENNIIKEENIAYLILEDGTVYQGESFGATGSVIGEVVFTTGMTGYQETLTDPSCFGQLVAQTFPLIGNYGLNDSDSESDNVWAKGYIVREWCKEPSNFRSRYNMDEYLKKHNIIGICGIDTRALTKKIREHGVMNGAIISDLPVDKDAFLKEVKQYVIQDAVKSVSCSEKIFHESPNAEFHVVLYDYGYKANILRCLLNRGCSVTVVPHNTSFDEILKINPEGIMLSNGPGDPAVNTEEIAILKELMGSGIPIFGICIGHQLLALANGAKSQKLKYGHRGANQPVMDIIRDQVFITSQNHGYAIMGDTLNPGIGNISHYNVNDGSCEGIVYKRAKAFTVQFHPKACSGPLDTEYLFDAFIQMMKDNRKD